MLTQVSVDGSYFGDMFFGLLLFGPGVGLAFTTASIAALAGVPEHESGLASGLSNTAFQVGAALGVAIVSTVAITRTENYLDANGDASPAVALTEGFQSAFVACVVLAGIGVVLALLLLGPPRQQRRNSSRWLPRRQPTNRPKGESSRADPRRAGSEMASFSNLVGLGLTPRTLRRADRARLRGTGGRTDAWYKAMRSGCEDPSAVAVGPSTRRAIDSSVRSRKTAS